jgi:nitrogen fixation/metabolism regulation signal transduction histidine kinase
VRGIAKVVTAVANGDLTQKLTVEAKGEIAALADTINGMTDTLATFADQVTTWRAKWAWKASWAARPRCRARPAPGRA